MNLATYGLVALALCLSAGLTVIDAQLPEQAWALVGLLVGAALPRPGDTTPTQLARELEAHDPTARVQESIDLVTGA